MAKGAFKRITLKKATLQALHKRAPDMPIDGFVYAVSRFIAPSDSVTPAMARNELEDIPAKAEKLREALANLSLDASDFLALCEHRHGVTGLTNRLEGELRQFLDLCEMARRDAESVVRPGRAPDSNTELVRDLMWGLRHAGKPVDATESGALVQAFDIAQALARKSLPSLKPLKDSAATVSKALQVLGKE